MNAGKAIVVGIGVAMAAGVALAWWMSTELEYQNVDGLTEITVGGAPFEVSDYVGTDNPDARIRLLGCFRIADPEGAVAAGAPAGAIEPRASIDAPGCKRTEEIRRDVVAGRAQAVIAEIYPGENTDLERVVAVYPDGEAYQWVRVKE